MDRNLVTHGVGREARRLWSGAIARAPTEKNSLSPASTLPSEHLLALDGAGQRQVGTLGVEPFAGPGSADHGLASIVRPKVTTDRPATTHRQVGPLHPRLDPEKIAAPQGGWAGGAPRHTRSRLRGGPEPGDSAVPKPLRGRGPGRRGTPDVVSVAATGGWGVASLADHPPVRQRGPRTLRSPKRHRRPAHGGSRRGAGRPPGPGWARRCTSVLPGGW